MFYKVKPVLFSMNPCVNILDNITSEIDTVHFYIDLKNSSTMLFIEDYVREVIDNTYRNNKPDSSIAQSLFYTICQWKTFFKNKNLKYKIFICNEFGESKYHTGIDKNYKSNRKYRRSIFLTQDRRDEFDLIKHRNWSLAKTVLNYCYNVHFIELSYLESDFIPYYLITRKYKNQKNIYHVLSSTDKDHYQILNIPNTIMFSKKGDNITIYDKSSYLAKYIKPDKNTNNIDKQSQYIELMSQFNSDYINVLMAFCGDSSDSIPGLPKIGEKTAIKMLTDLNMTNKFLGSLKEIDDRVSSGGNLLLPCTEKEFEQLDKNWKLAYQNNKLVTNSYKLISYECLCRNLEERNSEIKRKNLDLLNEFDNTINNNDNEVLNKIKNVFLNLDDCNFDEPLIEQAYY